MKSTFRIILSQTILDFTIFIEKSINIMTKLTLLCHVVGDGGETLTLNLSCAVEREVQRKMR